MMRKGGGDEWDRGDGWEKKCVQKCNYISLMASGLQIIRDGRVFLFSQDDRVGSVSMIFDIKFRPEAVGARRWVEAQPPAGKRPVRAPGLQIARIDSGFAGRVP